MHSVLRKRVELWEHLKRCSTNSSFSWSCSTVEFVMQSLWSSPKHPNRSMHDCLLEFLSPRLMHWLTHRGWLKTTRDCCVRQNSEHGWPLHAVTRVFFSILQINPPCSKKITRRPSRPHTKKRNENHLFLHKPPAGYWDPTIGRTLALLLIPLSFLPLLSARRRQASSSATAAQMTTLRWIKIFYN
jgi:hypothetical protein